jgi:nucleoid-associated protein EbfC
VSKQLGQILSQAKKMQERMQRMQEELATRAVDAHAGGGMVSCVVNGKQELLSLRISDEIWEERDKELLEDLLIAAVNEGLNKSRDMVQEEMSKIAGISGLQLPF